MAGKRGNNEGTIFKRADGRWVAAVTLPDGTRKHYYGKRRTDVAGRLSDALKDIDDGLPPVNEKLTLAEFLQRWLEASASTVRPRTHRRYAEYVRLHAIPVLGKVPVALLRPEHLQKLYADRLAAGSSPSTVAHLHAVLHRALGQAARWRAAARNVAELVDPPRVARQEMHVLSPEEVRRLLRAAEADDLEAFYVLAVTTGARLGELLGLHWRDVDLDGAGMNIVTSLQRTQNGLEFAEPKTARSRRRVSLAAVAVKALRDHRKRQNEARLAAKDWDDLDLVFCNEKGRPIEDGNLRRRSFVPLLKKACLPAIRLHDLRHTAATLMLGQGIHPKIAAEMLGHSQIAITLDLYSHVTPTMQRQATEAIDALLTSGA